MADLPVVIVGAGPAGLMAAQVLGEAGYRVQVFDRMPAPGRKFLRAGIGGLNLTHSEPARTFLDRYEPAAAVAPWLQQLDADGVRQWAALLGVETFTGTSGRVFPVQKKASPLLRAWLRHLDSLGVELHTRHQWQGWTTQNTEGQDQQIHRFSADGENREIAACATVLALGGGSWARLGSDGAWTGVLSGAGITVKELAASNCGFDYPWSEFVAKNFAGQPLKTVKLTLFDDGAEVFSRRGESLISRNGIQGSLVYAASRTIRQLLEKQGAATLCWDLMPDHSHDALMLRLQVPRGKTSLGNYLRKRLGLNPVKTALLRELAPECLSDMHALASAIKALPMTVKSARPVDEAISTAGGVALDELDTRLMFKKYPGVFCAGEMLDWDAPTGGYLLTACLAGGKVSAQGVMDYLAGK